MRKLTLFILLSIIIGCSGSSDDDGFLLLATAEAEDTDVPIIETQPVNQTLPADKTAVFSVEAANRGTVSYQWQFSEDASTWNDIIDATKSTYSILACTCKDNNWNWFRCELSNKNGTTCSDPAGLMVVTVIYVDYSKNKYTADGQSWGSAYTTLHDALNNAQPDMEIWVAEGTYTPGATREDSFTLKEDVAVYGGFTGDETFREARNWEVNVTTLSGDIGTIDDNSDNCYHVVTGANNAILDGFNITGGNANGGSGIHSYGGGIYNGFSSPAVINCTISNNSAAEYGGGIYNHGISPAVINCTFSNNSAAEYGGGIYNNYSSPAVINCTFSGNSAEYGGGMFNLFYSSPTLTNCTFSGNSAEYGGGMSNIDSSSPTITNCTISDNSAASLGGGMYNYESSSPTITNCTFSDNDCSSGGGMCNIYSSPAITDCTFLGNSAENNGGGIYNNRSSPILTNCTFSNNSANNWGGGMCNYDSSSATLTNCTFSGNDAASKGGGMYSFFSSAILTNCTFSDNSADYGGGVDIHISSATLTNCILWGNTASYGHEIYNDNGDSSITITYSCVQEGPVDNGNIADDPGLNYDLTLKSDSPCIDKGNNDAVPNGISQDLAGKARISGDFVDMGAYEYQQ